MTSSNGAITTKTADDGLNDGTFIYINGRNIYAYSTSSDAIDSERKITVTGGKQSSIFTKSSLVTKVSGSVGPECWSLAFTLSNDLVHTKRF
ncbi:hypothetical protein [Dyadobacter sp. LHD-138]|uniref:hypothetical protein n=1 Tax=Dyadobacter sp. LHD-138 TaxID=3071413 RepID=UPI0027E20E4A|nr:hypothetical protein [Dyadobacter sp. LHD-138]MDQ6480301.1 hypothetical protein [Dyadobacter sp. LHD-138]